MKKESKKARLLKENKKEKEGRSVERRAFSVFLLRKSQAIECRRHVLSGKGKGG